MSGFFNEDGKSSPSTIPWFYLEPVCLRLRPNLCCGLDHSSLWGLRHNATIVWKHLVSTSGWRGKGNAKLGSRINYLWLPVQQITFQRPPKREIHPSITVPSNQECNVLSPCVIRWYGAFSPSACDLLCIHDFQRHSVSAKLNEKQWDKAGVSTISTLSWPPLDLLTCWVCSLCCFSGFPLGFTRYEKCLLSCRNHFAGYTPLQLYYPLRTVIYMEITLWLFYYKTAAHLLSTRDPVNNDL